MDPFNNLSSTAINDAFGPSLVGHFDLTLTFEQSILSILPSALLLAVSPFRIVWLFRKATCARSGWLLWTKLVSVIVFLTLQVAIVARWGMPSTSRNRVSLAAAVLALVGSFTIAVLVYAEHRRSVKPSTLLVAYLATSLLLDMAQARSLFLQHFSGHAVLAGLFVTALATKFALLLLEEVPKRSVLTGNLKTTALESTSGPINRSVFWWINELFVKGFRDILKVGDLDAIDDTLASERLLARLGPAWKKSDKSAKHSLLLSTWSAFQAAFLLPVLPRLCLAGFKFAQPFLVNRVISFVGGSNDNESRGVAGGLIGATALIYIGLAISRCLYNHFVYRLITKLRGGLVSLVYGKTTQLSVKTAKHEAATTLMSTDIDGIASGIKDMHEIWANIFELGVAVYLLSRQIGSACFLAVIPAVLCSFVTEWATDGMGPARGQWNGGVQKRVSATSSMLAQMKGLKMMGLSDYMSSLIQRLRVAELNLSKKFRMFIVRIIMISNFSDQMTPAVVVIAAVFWTRAGPGGFNVSEAFTALSIVALVSTPVANLMGSYPNFVSSLACFDRIQKFLLSDKHMDDRSIKSSPSIVYKTASSDVIFVSGTSRNPESEDSDLELQKVSSTGHYKSTIGVSVEFADATFTLDGKTEPILQSISLSLEKSSLTMIIGPVGSGKSSLLKAILGELPPSTGSVRVEQAGISIAYCDQTPWLRNISIRNNIVGQSAFDQEYYTAVLQACDLQQDISHFIMGDETLVGSGGITLSGGQKSRVTLARAIYARKQITLLDDVFSALDTATSRHVFEGILGPKGLLLKNGITTVLASNTIHHLPFADHIIVLDQTGDIIQRGGFAELQSQDGYVKDLALQAHSAPTDRTKLALDVEAKADTKVSSTPAEDPAWQRQTGDFSLYKFYFRSVGAPLAISFLCLAVGYIFMGKLPEIWVRIWTENGTITDKGTYAGAYIAFCLATVLLSGLAVGFFMVVVIPKSAVQLHWLLLEAVVNAPLWFFTTTDTGVTLNRFSQDMTLVDQALPMAFFETTFDTLDVIAGTALIASGAQYVAAVVPLCIVPLFFLQKVYLRTSRQLRHLDLEAKSPLYTHFTETLSGVVTIRAFGWETAFVEQNMRLLDLSQKPYYLLFCVQRWLGVVMDLFVAGIAVVLVAFAVEFTSTTSRGAIGLAMINIVGFNNSLSRLISSWTSLETSLGAIARLRDFLRDTPKEESVKRLPAPPADWPSMGALSLSNVTATYHSNDETILHNISINIPSGTKVGICGRTGSGKSSFLLTILRLLETTSGNISIDDLPLSSLPRNALRSCITTLPQDPVILPGTIRDNLDPHSRCSSDEGIISALQKILLWEIIDGRGGLDASFDTLELSHGQQQLFSLARAILDKKKVVLLDEATSSVDIQTDRIVQKVIRKEFKDCTVMAVAHRLETIGDMDMVIVIDQGKIVEVGDPKVLKDQHGSLFGSLWENRHR